MLQHTFTKGKNNMDLEVLDDTIELLTKQMLEDVFKDKKENKKEMITMSKVDLYKFCIDLVKLIKRVENMEEK